MPVIIVLAVLIIRRAVKKARRYRESSRYESTPLGDDEWRKARRKLSAKSSFRKR